MELLTTKGMTPTRAANMACASTVDRTWRGRQNYVEHTEAAGLVRLQLTSDLPIEGTNDRQAFLKATQSFAVF